MNTNSFNLIDNIIAKRRLSIALKYVNKGDNLLDFGCGSQGFLLKSVSSKINRGVGLDFDVENVDMGNLSFKKFVFKDKLPFKDNYFDKIVLLAVLEHIELELVQKIFSEFHRVLRKGGMLILTTPTPKSRWLLEILSVNLGLISKDQILDHKKYYSLQDLNNLSKACRFKVHEYRQFQFGLNSLVLLKKSSVVGNKLKNAI